MSEQDTSTTGRTDSPMLSMEATRRAVQRSAILGPKKPGRSVARIRDAEIAKRMPSIRRRRKRQALDARSAAANRPAVQS